MMKVAKLVELINGTLETTSNMYGDVTCVFTCDLLSWVMAKGKAGCAWITVQTHLNVVAVASLHEMACIICPEGIRMEETSINRAAEEGIAVITSPLSAYEICGVLYDQNLPSV